MAKTPQAPALPGMTPLGIKPRARKFKLQFDCDNDTFANDLHNAIADALRDVAKKVRDGNLHGLVRDENGNTIGEYDLRSK